MRSAWLSSQARTALLRWTGCRSAITWTFRSAWRASRSRKPGNTVAVKRPVQTVHHSAPREAIADMTFTRRRRPFTLTTGVRPGGAQQRPGGAGSERSPHWSAQASTAFSAFARAAMTGYSSSSQACPFCSCCWSARRAGRAGVKPCRRSHLPTPRSVIPTPVTRRISSRTAAQVHNEPPMSSSSGRVVRHRLNQRAAFLITDQLVWARPPGPPHRQRLPAATAVGRPPAAHGPRTAPENLSRLPVGTHRVRFQRGHHPQPHHLPRGGRQPTHVLNLDHTLPTSRQPNRSDSIGAALFVLATRPGATGACPGGSWTGRITPDIAAATARDDAFAVDVGGGGSPRLGWLPTCPYTS